ncbi:hypothetical protein PG614_02520 [Riemerella anatipestifer]|nr:hypothetical protein [Riemerella anatipestifer]MDY3532631.1 hypothetical protein [Riemerella anatipestifer]MDY3534815.1 hypothetical protein [Riemerella anatipestifer]
MNTQITSKSEIKKELETMQVFLESVVDDDPGIAVSYGNDALVYYSRSGKLLADAKMHKDRKLRSELVEQIKVISGLSASVANKFIDTLTEEENYLVNWADRINAALARRADFCRTMISKAKEEMRLTQISQQS